MAIKGFKSKSKELRFVNTSNNEDWATGQIWRLTSFLLRVEQSCKSLRKREYLSVHGRTPSEERRNVCLKCPSLVCAFQFDAVLHLLD